MSLRAWAEIFIAGVLAALGWTAYSSLQAHAEAVALAERAAGETLEARRRADVLSDSARAAIERTAQAIAEAERERSRADHLADSLKAVGLVLTAETVATGASLLEAVEAAQALTDPHVTPVVDTIAVRVERHLEADRLGAENFRLRLAEMARAREAADSLAVWWRERAMVIALALEARTLECEKCAVSEELFREAAQPSFFRGLLDDAGKIVVAVGATALTVILIV